MDQLVIESVWQEVKNKKNVIGYSKTLKPYVTDDGKVLPDTKVIRIYVTKKEPLNKLSAKDLIPKAIKVSEKCVETDVYVIGELKALNNKERLRPLVAGISAMHKNGTACTVNGFFKDNDTGEILVASNNHCFAMENKATVGDELIQPGPYDGGKLPEDFIGRLKKFVEVKFTEFTCPYRNAAIKLTRLILAPRSLSNKVDIAFGSIEVPYEVACNQLGKIKGRIEFKDGDIVTKSGRTTEVTQGTVIDTDYTGQITYSRGTAVFTDCYLIQGAFSAGGDSGSPVLDLNGNYGGALFAGSETHTIVCKLSNIESEGNVTLVLSPDVN